MTGGARERSTARSCARVMLLPDIPPLARPGHKSIGPGRRTAIGKDVARGTKEARTREKDEPDGERNKTR